MQNQYMQLAIKEAKKALLKDEVPIGAVIVDSTTDNVISKAHNLTITNNDPTAHAEILAIRNAAKKMKNHRLNKCDLYITLEPCPMCLSAISTARIRRVYFGAYDNKSGGTNISSKIFKQCHHIPEIYGGISEIETSKIISTFFKGRRQDTK